MDLHSFTEENYLKIIYSLTLSCGQATVSTNAVAEMAQTKAASVSDMLKKLAEKKLVHYVRYQGVSLTAQGKKIALKVIRKHRLWELFLVEKLHFSWHEVHAIAEQLEHIHSDILVDRLDQHLGYPKFDPHGDPIPDAHGRLPEADFQPLTNHTKGQTLVLMGVSEHATAFLTYLEKLKLTLGTQLHVLDINEYDQSLQVSINQATAQFISYEVAKNLLVKIV
jgi:DtxR family transcriptional regulator, Mn-dependent transcriptional regulator